MKLDGRGIEYYDSQEKRPDLFEFDEIGRLSFPCNCCKHKERPLEECERCRHYAR